MRSNQSKRDKAKDQGTDPRPRKKRNFGTLSLTADENMIIKIGSDVSIKAYKTKYNTIRVAIHAPKDLIIERVYLPPELKGQEFHSNDTDSQIVCPIVEKRKG